MRILSLFICLLTFMQVQAQDSTDYYQPGYLRYENHIYKPEIKTVLLERNNEPLSDAVIVLNSEQQLKLQFDELTDESKNYYYRFILCDFNWQPSVLHESDYTEGFFYEQVQDRAPSFNTYQVYYHYSTVFPTAQMRFKKSGNYLLVVYDNENPDQAVITRRFRVMESMVNITHHIHRATVVEYRNSHQEIDFGISFNDYPVGNPYTDLLVEIKQNGREDNVINDLKPLFVKDKAVEYNYEDGNLFNGGNEFRTFDLRTVLNTTPYVKSVMVDPANGKYHAELRTEESRSFERYSILDDIDGKYLIKIYDGRNDQTESDYVYVTFHLKYAEPGQNGSFYIMGQLTDWTLLPEARMKYDYENHEYTTTLYVKQGYYNYQYLWVEDGKTKGNETVIEGNHFETENDYTIAVFHRDPVLRYDRLVGLHKFTSRNIY